MASLMELAYWLSLKKNACVAHMLMNPKLHVSLYLLVNNIFISLYFISNILNFIISQPDLLSKN